MKARVHVKASPSLLAELQEGALADRADDFSAWVREALRKAAKKAIREAGRRAEP